jgi:hypothetical protein
LTDYVLVSAGKKVHKYKTYLEAEVFVADFIGEKIEKKGDKIGNTN